MPPPPTFGQDSCVLATEFKYSLTVPSSEDLLAWLSLTLNHRLAGRSLSPLCLKPGQARLYAFLVKLGRRSSEHLYFERKTRLRSTPLNALTPPISPQITKGIGFRMWLPSIFRKSRPPLVAADPIDDELATRECATGLEQLQQGLLDAASISFEKAIKANPAHFDALHLQGIVALQRGALEPALDLMQRAILVNPLDAGVRSNCGLVLNALRRPELALKCFHEAIRLQPGFHAAYLNASLAQQQLGDLQAALAGLTLAASIPPPSAEIQSSLGDVYQRLSRYQDAHNAYRHALALNPQLIGTRINFSGMLMDQHDHAAALEQLDRALDTAPDSFEAHLNRGLALFKLGRFPESLVSSARAIQLNPTNSLALANHGATLEESLQLPAAFEAYNAALEVDPTNASVHVNKGILLLLTGELSAGWKEYDWRWRDPAWIADKRTFRQPRWTGNQSIRGKTVLVHNDQGLGDVMQFSRYVPLMIAAGAKVVLEPPAALVGLMRCAETGASCLDVGDPIPAFDFQTTFSDLPFAFNTELHSIPPATHFRIPDQKLALWRVRLGFSKVPRIGLVWRGNPKHKNDANRSIPLQLLANALPRNIQPVSLQIGLNSTDQNVLNRFPWILRFENELTDFEETAALCSLLDAIVTVDTSVAHLAGSLGKKVWLLLPYLPDWRWMLSRTDSPWYPTVTLLRQPTPNQWQQVLLALNACW